MATIDLSDFTEQDHPTSLLDLPAELRNRIYEEVVANNKQIELSLSVDSMELGPLKVKINWKLHPGEPALALASKALYDDVCSIYFNTNTFIWRCDVDDYEGRTYPLEQIDLMKRYLGKHVKHLRHFYFTIEYLVSFPNSVARRLFEIRTHILPDGSVKCERYSCGGFNLHGYKDEYVEECCGCDLESVSKRCEEQEWNLLELARDFISAEGYSTRFTMCESCGLQRNRAVEEEA